MTEEEKKEKFKKLKKKFGKKSLPIRIMESDLYDWAPGVMMTLMVIALGQRSNPEAWIQEDCPLTAEEAIGWCDQAQWRIALRAKKSESQVQEDITRFEEDGVIEVMRWTDSNNVDHAMYRIIEAMVDSHQRPEQKRAVQRPSRYKTKRGKNSGSFSTQNQPGRRSKVAAAGVDDE